MSHTREEKIEAFGRFIDILDILREKCPWDHKQTNESLRPNTIEETYELCDALIRKDNEATKKELGDVLLHIAFYAKIGEENGSFDIADVCNALCEKLIYRHPHVFGTTHVDGSNEVEQNWEELKLKEKGGNKTVLEGVPSALPALIKAYRIQDKARNVGFDWEEKSQVWDKVFEEFGELKNEIENTRIIWKMNSEIYFSVSSMRQDFMTSTRKMHWNIRTKSLYDGLTTSNRKHYKKVKI